MRRNFKYKSFTFLLLSPWLITFCAFWLYPLIYAGVISLTYYQTLNDSAKYIGLANYTRVFSDPAFLIALKNTAIFTFGTVPVTTALAMVLASIVNSKTIRFKNFFKSAFFAPSVTSLVVIALIFTNLYSKSGYVNALLNMAGMPYPTKGWLLEPGTALLSIMIMDVWISVGYYMALFLAGMQTISNDLYDYAKLAGAGPVRTFFRITLPLLKPTLLFVLVINTIKSFQIFVEIFVMTKGGPMNSTTTLVYMIYQNAFEKTDGMGYAAALAFVLFFILLVLSLVQMRLLKSDSAK